MLDNFMAAILYHCKFMKMEFLFEIKENSLSFFQKKIMLFG